MEFGWDGPEDPLEELCKFLVNNDFFKWHQVRGEPNEWQGASEFQQSELEILRKLQVVGKKRPR